jgi:hypothetical protein
MRRGREQEMSKENGEDVGTASNCNLYNDIYKASRI